MKTIAIYNNKGGVGKSVSVINIAYRLSEKVKVLVIDTDGQSNCSKFFTDTPKEGLEKAFTNSGEKAVNALCETRYPNIEIITSTSKMNGIIGKFSGLNEARQKENVERILACGKNCEYVLVDLPPALNSLTKSVISVCDYVFVPIELGTFAVQGIPAVTGVISDCGTKFGGCFVNKFDKKNSTDIEMLNMLRSTLGNKALKTCIPLSNVIKNSISCKQTADEYMKWTAPAKAYGDLVEEIIERTGE